MSISDDAPVITGVGLVCGLGIGLEPSVEAALAGRCAIGDCTALLEAEGYGPAAIPRAALVPEEVQLVGRAPLSRSTRYAVDAATEALGRARLDPGDDVDPDRVGVVSGSAAPSGDLYFIVGRQLVDGGVDTISGRTAPHLSAAAPAAGLALLHQLRGPNLAVSSACATGALVLLSAADQIRAGRADVMVAVAAESPVSLVGLTSFAAAKAAAEHCRPFDAARRGLVLGEGAAALVVESAAHARARRAPVLATLLGGALTDDAHHMWTPEPGSWARTVSLALEDAGVVAGDVDYVAAHAAGTPAGDAAEVAALHKALGSRSDEIPVWSTKGMHGHALGATGAIETILAVESLRRGRVPQTVGLSEADPVCDLDHVADPGRAGAPGVVVKDSFGFGGTNCVIVLDVHEPALVA